MKNKEKNLKEKLIKIKKNNYITKEENYFELGLEMLENIGSKDYALRDSLIYNILANWVLNRKFTDDQLEELLKISLNENQMFYKINADDEYGVLKRSFSVLIVALIINVNNKHNFLSRETLYYTKEKIIRYMSREKDIRGYINKYGWAHSVAHTSDALDELAQYTYFGKDDLIEILESIRLKSCVGYYVYVDEEDERMVTAVESVLNRNIVNFSEVTTWLESFSNTNKSDNYINNFHANINIKNFLRSLYFRLLNNEDFIWLIDEIEIILKEI